MLAPPLPGLRLIGLLLATAFAVPAMAEETPKILRVVSGQEFPPFNFTGPDGTTTGLVPERWQRWQRATGIQVQLITLPWAEAQKAIQDGSADVIEPIARTPKREPLLDFSAPYTAISGILVFHKSLSGIVDVATSRPFTIGAQAGDACIERLAAKGRTDNVLVYPSSVEVIRAATSSKIHVFCMNAYTANYLLARENLTDEFRRSPLLSTTSAHWAVRKGNSALLAQINAGFARIPEAELRAMQDKWLGAQMVRSVQPPYLKPVLYGAGALALAALALFGWNYLLRYQVRQRTEALNQSLTATHAAQAALERLNHEQSATLVAIPDLLIELADDGMCRQVLASRHASLASEAIALLGKHYRQWLPADSQLTLEQALDAARNAGSDFGRCLQLMVQGQPRWFELSLARKTVPDSGSESFLILARDVTDRIETEVRLRNYREGLESLVDSRTRELNRLNAELQGIFDSATVGIVLLQDDRIVSGNRKLDILFGYPAGALIGKSLQSFFADEPAFKAFRTAASQPLFSREEQLQRHDGSRFWARLTGQWLDIKGQARRTVAVLEDISQEKQAAAMLVEARNLAEANSQAKSNFLATMSHEIRTPMNAIIGMSYLALQTELTPRQRNYIQKVHLSAVSLLGILNDILDFSKIEAGRMSMESVDFELSQVLDNLVSMFSMRAQEKGLELIFDIDPAIPPMLVGDPLRLGQVLANLLSNAIKFTEHGDIVLQCRCSAQTAERATLRFAVSDTGIGMSADQVSRLFGAFSQADNSISRRFGGSGLGLAISQRLTQLMGSEISVASQPDTGSIFSFSLDLAVSHSPLPAHRQPNQDWQQQRALVVDDNQTAAEILRDMLQHFGFVTDMAFSGPAGLAHLRQASASGQPYALLLCDWKMPDMEGTEVVRQLFDDQDFGAPPAIVMVSAFETDVLRQRLEDAQLTQVGILAKPVSPSTLYDQIAQVINSGEAAGGQRQTVRQANLNLQGLRVLLVEDNEINQELAIDLLQNEGVAVEVAANGEQALQLLAQAPAVDAVLMDVQMPVMDGLQATRAIRQQPRFADLPIIAMSASALQSDREAALDAGMNDHVSKPISPNHLFQTLARWARRSDPGQSNQAPPALPATPIGPKLPGIDQQTGLYYLGGNSAVYQRLLARFASGYKDFAERLQAAAGDLAQIKLYAHSLRGTAGTIGAEQLSRLAGELEQASADPATLQPQQAALLAELQRVLQGLAQLPAPPPRAPTAPSAEHSVPAHFATQLQTLHDLLAAHDTEAQEQLDALLQAGDLPDALRTALSAVQRAIGNYDFERAQLLLDELRPENKSNHE